MLKVWEPNHYFRLLICHSAGGSSLALELRRQLPDFGFACHVVDGSSDIDLSLVDRLLNSMDSFLALLTPEFGSDPLCNQAAGVALGRGVLMHAIEINAGPVGFFQRITNLASPTASALPRLVANAVGRDPLSSERLSIAAVRALSDHGPSMLEERLACLESLRLPSPDAVTELARLRRSMQGKLQSGTVAQIDRLLERWQQQLVDTA